MKVGFSEDRCIIIMIIKINVWVIEFIYRAPEFVLHDRADNFICFPSFYLKYKSKLTIEVFIKAAVYIYFGRAKVVISK